MGILLYTISRYICEYVDYVMEREREERKEGKGEGEGRKEREGTPGT